MTQWYCGIPRCHGTWNAMPDKAHGYWVSTADDATTLSEWCVCVQANEHCECAAVTAHASPPFHLPNTQRMPNIMKEDMTGHHNVPVHTLPQPIPSLSHEPCATADTHPQLKHCPKKHERRVNETTCIYYFRTVESLCHVWTALHHDMHTIKCHPQGTVNMQVNV